MLQGENGDMLDFRYFFLIETEDPFAEFKLVGVFGLATIHFYVKQNRERCRNMMRETQSLPVESRFPFLAGLLETCYLLTSCWGIVKGGKGNQFRMPPFISAYLSLLRRVF